MMTRGPCSGLNEPAGLTDNTTALGSTSEEEIQNREIGNEIAPELGIDGRFVLVIYYLDAMVMEEGFIKVLVRGSQGQILAGSHRLTDRYQSLGTLGVNGKPRTMQERVLHSQRDPQIIQNGEVQFQESAPTLVVNLSEKLDVFAPVGSIFVRVIQAGKMFFLPIFLVTDLDPVNSLQASSTLPHRYREP
jgi:hypothetical protein